MFKETPRLKNEPSSLPKAQALGYTARKPRGPVLENTNHAEVATPTVKRGFVTPKFWGRCPSIAPPWFRAGWGERQRRPHGFGRVFNIPPTRCA